MLWLTACLDINNTSMNLWWKAVSYVTPLLQGHPVLFSGPDKFPKLPLHVGDLDPNTWFLWLTSHRPQMASRWVQSFLHSISMWSTHQQTHRHDICCNRLHLCYACDAQQMTSPLSECGNAFATHLIIIIIIIVLIICTFIFWHQIVASESLTITWRAVIVQVVT